MEGSGILLEVERGKTSTSNMDLLDFWKCHLCRHADYPFLMAPQAFKHNDAMTPKKEYASVLERLKTSFAPGNATNVRPVPLGSPPNRVFTERVTDPAHARGVESAMTGLIASLASWGVVAGHWLPDRDGLPALWLTTQTDTQRRALEKAPWLEAQVAILLTRAEVPYEVLKRIRVLVESEEGHHRLLRDDD